MNYILKTLLLIVILITLSSCKNRNSIERYSAPWHLGKYIYKDYQTGWHTDLDCPALLHAPAKEDYHVISFDHYGVKRVLIDSCYHYGDFSQEAEKWELCPLCFSDNLFESLKNIVEQYCPQ